MIKRVWRRSFTHFLAGVLVITSLPIVSFAEVPSGKVLTVGNIENSDVVATFSNADSRVIRKSKGDLFRYEKMLNGVTICIEAEPDVVPENATVLIVPVDQGKLEMELAEDEAESMVAFDIKFLVDGQEVQPNGNVKISFFMPGMSENKEVFHISEENQVEVIDAKKNKEGALEFTAKHFSIYGLRNTANSVSIIESVTSKECTSDGHLILCDIRDDVKVEKVVFTTWTEKDGKDDVITTEVPGTDIYQGIENTYGNRVYVYQHNFEYGVYNTEIKVYDEDDNVTESKIRVVMPRPFNAKNDGWPLMNASDSFGYKTAYFIPVELYEETFGTKEIKVSRALVHHRYLSLWGGSCFGLSILAAHYYTMNGRPLNDVLPVRKSNDLYDRGYSSMISTNGEYGYFVIRENKEAVRLIERAHIAQHSREVREAEVFKDDEHFEKFIGTLSNGEDGVIPVLIPYVLGLSYSDGGHAVTVERNSVPWDAGENWAGVFVYDSNSPDPHGIFEKGIDPLHWYKHSKSYVKFNTATGDWEYYCDNEKVGSGKRYDLCIIDPTKLDMRFYTEKLHEYWGKSLGISAEIAAEDIVIRNTLGEDIFEITNGVVTLKTDDAKFTALYTDGPSDDRKMRGYLEIKDNEIEYEMNNAEILTVGDQYSATVCSENGAQGKIDLIQGTVHVSSIGEGSVSAGIQTMVDDYSAIGNTFNAAEGDYIKLQLNNVGQITVDTNAEMIESVTVDSAGTLVELGSIDSHVLENVTVQRLVDMYKPKSISISETNVEIRVDEKKKLQATMEPENAVLGKFIWTSSNENVVSVESNGTLTGLNEGTVIITVYGENYPNIKANCIVTVKPKSHESGLPQKIVLSKNFAELYIGDKLKLEAQLEAENLENSKIEWISSNTQIALVDINGDIYAVAAGTVEIRASLAKNPDIYDTCVIIVKHNSDDDGEANSGSGSNANLNSSSDNSNDGLGENSEATAKENTYPGARWKHLEDGNWKLIKKNNSEVHGWALVNGLWYYLNYADGRMMSGWVLVNGQWYYLDRINGHMMTGWICDQNKWYYLLPSGSMATGWLQINEKWYYFDVTGMMLSDTITPDGYKIDKNGVWSS